MLFVCPTPTITHYSFYKLYTVQAVLYRKRRSVYTPYMYGDYNELEDGGTATEDVAEEDGKVGEVGSDAYSVSVSSPGVDQRQVIEIIFKLIGQ